MREGGKGKLTGAVSGEKFFNTCYTGTLLFLLCQEGLLQLFLNSFYAIANGRQVAQRTLLTKTYLSKNLRCLTTPLAGKCRFGIAQESCPLLD